jgi:cephalosporin hydroxylase
VSYDSLSGWFDYELLYDRAIELAVDGDTLVEVGVYRGRSLMYLARRMLDTGKSLRIVGVDTFTQTGTSYVECVGGMLTHCPEEARAVEICAKDSVTAAKFTPNDSVKFCWIDAAHDYDSVRTDILAWMPKVEVGGVLAGHDWNGKPDDGVVRAVRELLPRAELGVGQNRNCWWIVRGES